MPSPSLHQPEPQAALLEMAASLKPDFLKRVVISAEVDSMGNFLPVQGFPAKVHDTLPRRAADFFNQNHLPHFLVVHQDQVGIPDYIRSANKTGQPETLRRIEAGSLAEAIKKLAAIQDTENLRPYRERLVKECEKYFFPLLPENSKPDLSSLLSLSVALSVSDVGLDSSERRLPGVKACYNDLKEQMRLEIDEWKVVIGADRNKNEGEPSLSSLCLRVCEIAVNQKIEAREKGFDIATSPAPSELEDIEAGKTIYSWVTSFLENRTNPTSLESRTSLSGVLARHSRLVLLSPAGSGKSTACLLLALASALPDSAVKAIQPIRDLFKSSGEAESTDGFWQEIRSRIPILVRLRDLNQKPPEESAVTPDFETVLKMGLAVTQDDSAAIIEACRNGRACILLDGLDELTRFHSEDALKSRTQLLSSLHDFLRSVPAASNRILITSRPTEYLARLKQELQPEGQAVRGPEFQLRELLDFDEANIGAFLTQWKTLHPHSKEHLDLKAIESRGLIPEAKNPLLLTVMAVLAAGESLPDTKAGVLKAMIKKLLFDWEPARGHAGPPDPITALFHSQNVDRSRLEPILEECCWLSLESSRKIGKSTLRKKLANCWLEEREETNGTMAGFWADEVITALVEKSGLLRFAGGDEELDIAVFTLRNLMAGRHRLRFSPSKKGASVDQIAVEWAERVSQGGPSEQEYQALQLAIEDRLVTGDLPITTFSPAFIKRATELQGHLRYRLLALLAETAIRSKRWSLPDETKPQHLIGVSDGDRVDLRELLKQFLAEPPVSGSDAEMEMRAFAASLLGCLEQADDQTWSTIQWHPVGAGQRPQASQDVGGGHLSQFVFNGRKKPSRQSQKAVVRTVEFELGDEFVWGGGRRVKARIRIPFLAARFPITVAEYQLFVDAGGYDVSKGGEEFWKQGWLPWSHGIKEPAAPIRNHPKWRAQLFQIPNHPRVGINWYEASAYCRWLNSNTGLVESCREMLQPGSLGETWLFRLPTEAEWEFMAVSSRPADSVPGKSSSKHPQYGVPWGYATEAEIRKKTNCEGQFYGTTAVGAGIFRGDSGNREGLEDLVGNILEWCSTVWQGSPEDGTYPDSYDPELESPDPKVASPRVVRGGSWLNRPGLCRSSYRLRSDPDSRYCDVGFRPVFAPGPVGAGQ